jgi:four helix bundle protein
MKLNKSSVIFFLMSSHIYKNYIVWNKSIEFTISIYEFLKDFPREEVYGICSQIKRAAVSIPSNIAEGAKRSSDKEFVHFLRIAHGSGAELETQLEISKRLNFGQKAKYTEIEDQLTEIMKMLNVFIKKLSVRN